MNEAFKIYIEQLRDGHTEKIDEKIDADFLDVKEDDLSYVDPVNVQGEAYLAESDLILHFDIETLATIPCAICNEDVKVPVNLKNFYHTVPTAEVKSGVYNFKELLRENILLTTPLFAECHNGSCPERDELKKFFRKDSTDNNTKDDGYHPFANL